MATRTLQTLDELVALTRSRDDLYVRWTPDAIRDEQRGTSLDELTGVELPGLSANPLTPEPWWKGKPLDLWVARRLHDYRHLQRLRGEGTSAWILTGVVIGRGPDNEPLIRCREIIARLDQAVTRAALELIDSCPARWGSLDRS